MRAVFAFFFAVGLFTGFAVAQTQVVKTGTIVTQDNRLPAHEPDTYRFGIAYLSTRGTTPGQCEAACNRDTARCASWTLTPATFQMGPRCELKRNIGAQEYRPGAVSGIALRFQPRGPELQQAFERRTAVPAPRATYKPAPMSAPRPMPQTRTVAPRPQPVTRPAPIRRAPAPAPQPVSRPAPSSSVELRGGPQPISQAPRTQVPVTTRTVTTRPAPAPRPVTPAPSPRPAAPAQQQRPPQFEMRPTAAPVPAPTPAPAPARQVQPVRRPAPTPAPAQQPQPQPTAQPVRQSAPAPTPAPVATAPTSTSGGVQIDPPPPPIQPRGRVPWHKRTAETPDYSVSDMDLIPGDEEATAGFIGGVPEE